MDVGTSLLIRAPLTLVRRIRYLHRRTVAFVAYTGVTVAAYALAFLLRFEFAWPREYTATFLGSLVLLVVIRHACHQFFRLTTGRWRFVGVHDVLRLGVATLVGTAVFFALTRGAPFPLSVPVSVVAGEAILNVLLTSAVWISYRAAFEALHYRFAGNRRETTRVLIVGAGESGYMLAREMSRRNTGYRPVGFVDDDPHKWGTRLAGLEVIGAVSDLRAIADAHGVQELILAVPHASPAQVRTIVDHCEDVGLPFRVLPSIAEVLAGDVRLEQVREVRIEDLLGREPVQLELQELAADLRDACVLITGAAGSIGSELARQIALHNPAGLVLFDQAETELYYLELEIRERHPRLPIVPVIGDVVDRDAVEAVFEAYAPTHVFHAAAYKHVPMMEANVRQAVRNNALGTWVVAEASGRHGVLRFVLVSTDKAVKPVSVMGATKRLAELVVLELQDRHPETVYAAVRFGNVLGSNGSVIPLFRRQLAAGRPLTVTHPDATRYFMTIPEAVQLILQASLLPEIRGQIAMLEMGEPVRILELARNLLRLAGNRSRRRSIVFTGLRPGEKLHEELVAPDEETIETAIPKVRLIKAAEAPGWSVTGTLATWDVAFRSHRDADVAAALAEIFPGLGGGGRELVASTLPVRDGMSGMPLEQTAR
ncbi:MAG TPA: nucleoside-diphosphate sugar epimerase/dehydratase [Longimicrobiaceae bacterium]|nr:nucleoside-diphosphate sugar epimerase/dehydratase [Longimicrobiaceae bacterium]